MEFIIQLANGYFIGFVAAVSPGPDTLLVLRAVTNGGAKAGARTTIGIGAALAVHAVVTVTLVSFFHDIASSSALKIVQLAGASYLAYLGLTLLWVGLAKRDAVAEVTKPEAPDARYFLLGFATNLTNPKAIVFFAAVVSQFITARDLAAAAAMLIGIVAAVSTWFLLLSLWSATLIGKMTGAWRTSVDLIAGILFLGLACFSCASAFVA